MRRRPAGGGCIARHSGTDHFQPVPGHRPRVGNHSRPEQDRHGKRAGGGGDRPGLRPAGLLSGGGFQGIGPYGRGRSAHPGRHRGQDSRAEGRSRRSAAGADFRLGFQPLPRHHRLFQGYERLCADGRQGEILQYRHGVRCRRGGFPETQAEPHRRGLLRQCRLYHIGHQTRRGG